MDTVVYEAQAEIFQDPSGDFNNPYLTYARFILLDDKPNGNKKGVEYEDFPRVAKSAIGMPVKLRYIFNGAGGHKASTPIGHIVSVEEKTLSGNIHQLVATAVLWEDEFPNEVKYLKEAYASGTAPGISWELGYNDEVNKNGVGWYKGVVTKAATFVRNPAYGTRTALLALASLDDDSQLEQELVALASRLKGQPKGGNNVDDAKEKEYQTKIADLEKQLAAAQRLATESDTALKTAQAELQTKDATIQEYEKNTLIADRTKAMTDIGFKLDADADKAKARQEFWAALPEETFSQYVTDLKAAITSKPQQTAVASLQKTTTAIPKLVADTQDDKSITGLAQRLKGAARGIPAS